MNLFILERVKGILKIVTFVVTFFLPCFSYADQVTLSWEKPDDSRVAGYNLYFGISGTDFKSRSYFQICSPDTTSYIFSDIETGFEYSFAATSFDIAGNESNFSETINYSVESASEPGSETQTVVFGDTLGTDCPGTVQDTFINLNEDVNYYSEQLNTYTWPENMPANAILFQFDLSQLPAGTRIQCATFSLYQTAAGGDASYDVGVHKVINHNPDLYLANGYTCDGVNDWTADDSCYNSIPLAQADIGAAEDVNVLDHSLGYKAWNVTEMVQEWASESTTNYGLILNSDAVASAGSYRFFAASEAIDAVQRPKLEIIFSIASGENDTEFTDTDGDLMDDNWEIENFGNITFRDGFDDCDHDGYSDYWEYANGSDPLDGTTEPGGNGYDEITDDRTTDSWSLDIDGNGEASALADGILVIRYLLGFPSGGATWIDGAVASEATRASAGLIEDYMKRGVDYLDIDGNGEVGAMTDGVLVVRYLLGFPSDGPTWIDGVLGAGATRISAEDIEAYIMSLMPSQQ